MSPRVIVSLLTEEQEFQRMQAEDARDVADPVPPLEDLAPRDGRLQ